jgi:AraC-like DNA-binding protein
MRINTGARLRHWRVPLLDDLELFHGSNMSHYYPPHVHQKYSVLILLRGFEKQYSDGVTDTASVGSLMLNNPDQPHASRSILSEYRIFRMGRESLRRLGMQVTGKSGTPYFPAPVVKDSLSFGLLLNLHLKLQQDISPLEQESEFISTMGTFLSRQQGRPLGRVKKETRYVDRVRDYLKSNYAETVTLSHLTALTNLSSFHLLRVFHRQLGFPPHEFQTQVRIAHARRLIRGGCPISQVALDTGFFDQSHLSRNFKRIVGMTPGQYSSQSKIVQDS